MTALVTGWPTTSEACQTAVEQSANPDSITAIVESLKPVREFEDRVSRVLEKVRPVTVAILFDDGGFASAATGVLVSFDGKILTAGHCVDAPGTKFTIMLHDGRKLPATSCGVSPSLDCGLIKIDKDSIEGIQLPFAELGWSSAMRAGDVCLSLGHSGGDVNGRPAVARIGFIVDPISPEYGMIRSSCLMEPGDSGGPLFDISGRVIGIHSFIGDSLNANYEVPIELYRRYWDDLQKEDTFRGHSPDNSPYGLKLIRTRGMGPNGHRNSYSRRRRSVRVSQVSSDGWANAEGIKDSDRIYAIGGENVSNSHQLEMTLFKHYLLGSKSVPIRLKRSGEIKEITLNFSKLPLFSNASEKIVRGVSRSSLKLTTPNSGTSLKKLKAKFSQLENALDDFSVSIQSGDKTSRTANDTIVRWNEANFVVSKSSIVGTSPEINWRPNGEADPQTFVSDIIYRNEQEDVVILSMAADAQSLDLRKASSAAPAKFRLLLSPGFDDDGEIGIVRTKSFGVGESGFLGVMPTKSVAGVTIDQVESGSSADLAGIKVDDVVKTIDGNSVKSPMAMIRLLSRTNVGDKIKFGIIRDQKALVIEAKLGRRPLSAAPKTMHVAETFPGGKSKRHKGFSKVLVHDSPVLPADCGGPAFSSNGEFIGINIARRSRTRSYVLPASLLVKIFEKAIR